MTTLEIWKRMGSEASSNDLARCRYKLDNKGNYMPFPNITIVSHVDHKYLPQLIRLPQELSRVAGEYVSPLPASSYHATLIGGPLACQWPQFWPNLLTAGCWSHISQRLRQLQFRPTNLVLAHPEMLQVADYGLVTVYLSPAGMSGYHNRNYTGDEATNKLRQQIRKAASVIPPGSDPSDQRTQPNEHTLMDKGDFAWHITLAYGKAHEEKLPDRLRQEIRVLVERCFGTLRMALAQRRPITFHPAELCLSPDMMLFQPWDGNPPQV